MGDEDILRLDGRVDRLEERIDKKFDTWDAKLDERFETSDKKLDEHLRRTYDKIEKASEPPERPCADFVAHVAEHEKREAWWRSMWVKVVGSWVVVAGLWIVAHLPFVGKLLEAKPKP